MSEPLLPSIEFYTDPEVIEQMAFIGLVSKLRERRRMPPSLTQQERMSLILQTGAEDLLLPAGEYIGGEVILYPIRNTYARISPIQIKEVPDGIRPIITSVIPDLEAGEPLDSGWRHSIGLELSYYQDGWQGTQTLSMHLDSQGAITLTREAAVKLGHNIIYSDEPVARKANRFTLHSFTTAVRDMATPLTSIFNDPVQ